MSPGAATGGLTVRAPVASAVANALFYTTAAGNIGASSTLTYDGASTISSTAASLKISSVTQTQFNGSGYYNYYSFCYGTSPVLGIFASSVASSTIGFSNIDSEINFAQHSTIFVTPYNAATTPFAVRGLASQTAPLFPLQQLSSTATARNCGIIDASFNTATDASWTGNLLLYAGDNTSSTPASGSASRSSPTAPPLSWACSGPRPSFNPPPRAQARPDSARIPARP